MTNCQQCSTPTNRHDNLCPNCFYIKPDSDNPQSSLEILVLETYKYACECGERRTRVLILMFKGNTFIQAGRPRTDRPIPRDKRAIQISESPELGYAQCHNCYAKHNLRGPGRPKKHKDEDRKWVRANYNKIYQGNINTKLLLSYGVQGSWPECVVCPRPATRTLYIGEFGKAPLGNHARRCRRLALLKENGWHMQFAPYCDFHQVSNIGERARQKKQIQHEQLLETLSKNARTLAIGG